MTGVMLYDVDKNNQVAEEALIKAKTANQIERKKLIKNVVHLLPSLFEKDTIPKEQAKQHIQKRLNSIMQLVYSGMKTSKQGKVLSAQNTLKEIKANIKEIQRLLVKAKIKISEIPKEGLYKREFGKGNWSEEELKNLVDDWKISAIINYYDTNYKDDEELLFLSEKEFMITAEELEALIKETNELPTVIYSRPPETKQ